ncbi:MAG: alpha-isopropylmalate synthase regulatory domain-containing protein, partial [Candidatus Puniceispirillaceae bacterium]
KDPRTYEHVPPEKVGNERHYLVSDQAGRSNMLARFAQFNIEIDPKDKRLDTLISVVKAKEFEGWSFDSAEASFELLARQMLGEVPEYFRIGRFRVMDERRFNARGELVVESEATTTIFVGDECFHEAAVGNGPVNAVDTAMRKALVAAYPSLADVELVDYKVRILDAAEGSGTGAITRVMIEFCVPDGTVWRTVGLSTNIIDASVAALGDGMIWKLQHDQIAGPKPKIK